MLEIGRALKESSTAVLEHSLRSLDLLSTPASVGITVNVSVQKVQIGSFPNLPHVCWGLDRGNVLQNSVGKTNNANKGTGDNAVPAIADGYATDENVDCGQLVCDGRSKSWTTYRYHGRGRRT